MLSMSRTLTFALFIILTSVWWAWTFLVDFFVIRTVFKIVDSFWTAGRLGMTLFTKLNLLELIVSTALITLLALHVRQKKESTPIFIASFLTWLIAVTYFTYLTPKLTHLTELWQQADLMGLTAVKGIPDIQQEHQFFHNLYIGIDSVKFLLLTIMLGFGVWRREKLF
jgi:hypothetical protein